MVWDDPELLSDPRVTELIGSGNRIARGVEKRFFEKAGQMRAQEFLSRESEVPGWTRTVVGLSEIDITVIAAVLDAQATSTSADSDVCRAAIENLMKRKGLGRPLLDGVKTSLRAIRPDLEGSLQAAIDQLLGQ
jgi:hypothetical protein